MVFFWNEKQTKFIMDNYPNMNIEEISKALNIEKAKVKSKVERLQKTKKLVATRVEKWTDEDVQFLKDNYEKMTAKEMANILNMNVHRVQRKIYKMRANGSYELDKNNRKSIWTNEEIQFLKDNYKKISVKGIAERVNKTETQVKSRVAILRKQGVQFKKFPRWTSEEEQFIKENYNKLTVKEIAIALDKSITKVSTKIFNMREKDREAFPLKINPLTDEIRGEIIHRSFNNNEKTYDIAASMKLSVSVVNGICKKERERRMQDEVRAIEEAIG